MKGFQRLFAWEFFRFFYLSCLTMNNASKSE